MPLDRALSLQSSWLIYLLFDVTGTAQLHHRFSDGIIRHCVYQANFQRAPRGDPFGGYKQLKRPSLPYDARKALRPSPTRDQAQGGAAMAEHRRGRGDPAVAREGEVQSSAHAVAFDGGDNGGRIAGDRVHECLPQG